MALPRVPGLQSATGSELLLLCTPFPLLERLLNYSEGSHQPELVSHLFTWSPSVKAAILESAGVARVHVSASVPGSICPEM